MDCIKCGKTMFRAGLTGFASGTFTAGLYNKEKGLFGIEKYSSLSCHVCPACGHVELTADDPEALILSGKSIFEEDK